MSAQTPLLGLLALLALPGACSPPAPAPPLTSDGGAAHAAQVAHGPRAAPHCRHDRDCPGYLRCEAGSCAKPPALDGDGPQDGPRVVFELAPGHHSGFWVELARDDAEHMRGLMFRPRMHPDWGMLFLFDKDRVHSFWMRNTYIPLDMIFLGSDGRIACIVEQAEPLTEESRSCGRVSRHVLELAGGSVRRHGLKAGQTYVIEASHPASAPPAGHTGGTP